MVAPLLLYAPQSSHKDYKKLNPVFEETVRDRAYQARDLLVLGGDFNRQLKMRSAKTSLTRAELWLRELVENMHLHPLGRDEITNVYVPPGGSAELNGGVAKTRQRKIDHVLVGSLASAFVASMKPTPILGGAKLGHLVLKTDVTLHRRVGANTDRAKDLQRRPVFAKMPVQPSKQEVAEWRAANEDSDESMPARGWKLFQEGFYDAHARAFDAAAAEARSRGEPEAVAQAQGLSASCQAQIRLFNSCLETGGATAEAPDLGEAQDGSGSHMPAAGEETLARR